MAHAAATDAAAGADERSCYGLLDTDFARPRHDQRRKALGVGLGRYGVHEYHVDSEDQTSREVASALAAVALLQKKLLRLLLRRQARCRPCRTIQEALAAATDAAAEADEWSCYELLDTGFARPRHDQLRKALGVGLG